MLRELIVETFQIPQLIDSGVISLQSWSKVATTSSMEVAYGMFMMKDGLGLRYSSEIGHVFVPQKYTRDLLFFSMKFISLIHENLLLELRNNYEISNKNNYQIPIEAIKLEGKAGILCTMIASFEDYNFEEEGAIHMAKEMQEIMKDYSP